MGCGRALAIALTAICVVSACGGGDGADANPGPTSSQPDTGRISTDRPAFLDDVRPAIEAVESELGADGSYFEVTANDRVTNVFVAVDDGSAAVAYAVVDGELQPPAPKRTGAEGLTFAGDDVTFDPARITSGVIAELPESEIEAISVYGNGDGVTYVMAVRSQSGGRLDVVVGADGQVFSVDPL